MKRSSSSFAPRIIGMSSTWSANRMTSSMNRSFFCVLALLAAVTAIAQAGAPMGAITGPLFDSIGDPIDNNAVQAKNTESGAVFKATTSATGKYTIADLPPGVYDISASAPGLRPYEKKG